MHSTGGEFRKTALGLVRATQDGVEMLDQDPETVGRRAVVELCGVRLAVGAFGTLYWRHRGTAHGASKGRNRVTKVIGGASNTPNPQLEAKHEKKDLYY